MSCITLCCFMWRFLRNKTTSVLIYFLREIPGKHETLLTLCYLAFDLNNCRLSCKYMSEHAKQVIQAKLYPIFNTSF